MFLQIKFGSLNDSQNSRRYPLSMCNYGTHQISSISYDKQVAMRSKFKTGLHTAVTMAIPQKLVRHAMNLVSIIYKSNVLSCHAPSEHSYNRKLRQHRQYVSCCVYIFYGWACQAVLTCTYTMIIISGSIKQAKPHRNSDAWKAAQDAEPQSTDYSYLYIAFVHCILSMPFRGDRAIFELRLNILSILAIHFLII